MYSFDPRDTVLVLDMYSGEDFICWNILVDSLWIYKPEYISETTKEILVLVYYCQEKGWYNIVHDIPVAQINAWHILDEDLMLLRKSNVINSLKRSILILYTCQIFINIQASFAVLTVLFLIALVFCMQFETDYKMKSCGICHDWG